MSVSLPLHHFGLRLWDAGEGEGAAALHHAEGIRCHAHTDSPVLSRAHACSWRHAQEAVVLPPCIALSLRPKVGRFLHCRICADTLRADDLSIANYKKVKEQLASAPSS